LAASCTSGTCRRVVRDPVLPILHTLLLVALHIVATTSLSLSLSLSVCLCLSLSVSLCLSLSLSNRFYTQSLQPFALSFSPILLFRSTDDGCTHTDDKDLELRREKRAMEKQRRRQEKELKHLVQFELQRQRLEQVSADFGSLSLSLLPPSVSTLFRFAYPYPIYAVIHLLLVSSSINPSTLTRLCCPFTGECTPGSGEEEKRREGTGSYSSTGQRY